MRILPFLLLLSACHPIFKREAPTLGAVRPQVVVTGGPEVSLGQMQGNGIVSTVVNVVQAANSINLAERVSKAVNIDQVNQAFVNSLVKTLGSGPPFGTTRDPKAPLLQLEVLSYGLEVPNIGAPGVFTYNLRARIYKPDGKRVYVAYFDCAIGAGDPSVPEVVFGVVNNIRTIKDMSDAELNQSFLTIADYCGQQVVLKMRKHASR
jgi:hypothetical protein